MKANVAGEDWEVSSQEEFKSILGYYNTRCLVNSENGRNIIGLASLVDGVRYHTGSTHSAAAGKFEFVMLVMFHLDLVCSSSLKYSVVLTLALFTSRMVHWVPLSSKGVNSKMVSLSDAW